MTLSRFSAPGALALAAFAIACAPFRASAQEAPVITIRKGDQIALAVGTLGGAEGNAVTAILQNDLSLAGWFAMVDAARAGYTVGGTAQGGQIQGTVTDRNGGVVLSRTYPGGRRGAHQFADDIVETVAGKKGIASSRVAFVGTRSGRKEIYIADYDGSGISQLTNDGSISVGPNLSADGSRLSYTGYKSGYADIYVIDTGSGSRNRAVKFPGTNTGGAFSPDGGRMAATVSRDGNPELYVVGTDGGGARRLTRSRGAESGGSWSPDGSEIVFSSDDGGAPQLYRISSGGGAPRRIATGLGYASDPNWSPDGTKIAFTTRGGGGFQVAVHDLQTGQTRTLPTGGSAEDPVWGANSRHLIYAQNGAVYLLDSVTGRNLKVIEGVGRISEPTWTR